MTNKNKIEISMAKFSQLKVAAKTKAGRGTKDAEAVMDALKDCWDDLSDKIKEMTESEKTELKNHFNNLIEDEDDLGD